MLKMYSRHMSRNYLDVMSYPQILYCSNVATIYGYKSFLHIIPQQLQQHQWLLHLLRPACMLDVPSKRGHPIRHKAVILPLNPLYCSRQASFHIRTVLCFKLLLVQNGVMAFTALCSAAYFPMTSLSSSSIAQHLSDT